MALFGHRGAHEDDAARAVHAALDIQAAIQACGPDIKKRVPDFARVLQSRAAVHTGLVLIGYVRESEGRRITAFGDTVSIAFRLQDQAAADSLLISAATQQLIGHRFVFTPAGRQVIRGIRDPLDVFQVTGIGPTVGRHDAARRGAATPIVGRDNELQILKDAWANVVEGEGQIVVLKGDPASGKSRLLAELKQGPAARTGGVSCTDPSTSRQANCVLSWNSSKAGSCWERPVPRRRSNWRVQSKMRAWSRASPSRSWPRYWHFLRCRTTLRSPYFRISSAGRLSIRWSHGCRGWLPVPPL